MNHYLGETPKRWLTEGPREEAAERTDQTEQTERLSDTEGDADAPLVDAEEQTAEETTPKGRDLSEKTGAPSADYVVDDTENRDRPKRGIRAPKYLGDCVRQLRPRKRVWISRQECRRALPKIDSQCLYELRMTTE